MHGNHHQMQDHHFDVGHSISEASLAQPAIISQSGLNPLSVRLDESVVRNPIGGAVALPSQFVKLFIARQQDLQLSKNIEQ